MKRIVCFLCALLLGGFLLFPGQAVAQEVTVRIERGTLDDAFQQIMKSCDIQLVYNTDVASKANCRAHVFRGKDIKEVLNELLQDTPLTYTVRNGIYTIVSKSQPGAKQAGVGTVSGRVFDEYGDPIIGAPVTLKGAKKGVVTDINGHFVIPDLRGDKVRIVISYLGKETLETDVKVNSNTRFILYDNVALLNELVVTGYQDISKEKMTGAVTTVRADDLDDRYSPSLLSNLEGRVAGLTTYAGKTTIRGTSSLYAETNPLLVVDGVPIEGSIEDLNPYDIESVNVLKDAAANAIYGARASNGVIVVTTKQAKTKGKIDVSFSANLTVYEKTNTDYHANFYMNPVEQVATESAYWYYYFFDNDGEVQDPINSTQTAINYGSKYISPIQYAYYRLAKGEITEDDVTALTERLQKNNYAKEYGDAVYRNRVLQQYDLALRSRSDKFQSSLVVNYKYDNSGQINTNVDQLNVNYKGSYDVAPWLTATFGVNGIYGHEQAPGYDYNASFTDPWAMPAYESLYNEDGSARKAYYWYDGNEYWDTKDDPNFEDMGVNVLEEFYNNTTKNEQQYMRYHVDLLFRPLKGLTVNTMFVYETEHNTTEWYANSESHAARTMRNAYKTRNADGTVSSMVPTSGGILRTTNTDGHYWTGRLQANYANTFGKHEVNALAGLEFRETNYKGSNSLAVGYDDQLQNSSTHTVDFGTLSTMNYSPYFMAMTGGFPCLQFVFNPYFRASMTPVTEVKHRYASGYANLTYTYDGKYNVFGSYRKDYADVYGLNAKFRGRPLWSVGAGWNAHNEDFMKEIDWVNFLKVRLSYGVTGNIYQGATSYMTATSSGNNDYTNLPYGEIESPANPNLKWEQSRTTNFGIDFSVLDNRLRGSIDYYDKVGKDIFSYRQLDPTTGFSSIFMNTASVRNRGVELSLTATWFRASRRNDFNWTTSYTFSHNKNEVTDVENPAARAYELISTPYKTGYPTSALWSYRFAGISDEEGMKGQTLWYAEDDAPVHAASGRSESILEYSGQSEPKVVMGMDNSFSWKGISLSVLMAYYGGHKMRALAKSETFAVPTSAIPSYFLDAWTPEDPTDTPGIGRYASTSIGSETTYGNNAIHDADFLKIRNIVLGYEFPETLIKPLGVNRLNLSFQINNPKYLWVKNDVGVDPETLGIRSLSSFVFGLHVNF